MVHHQSELYEHGSPSARCVRILGFALTAATMGKALRKPRHAAKSASTSGSSSLLTMAVAMAVAAILAGGAVLYWTQSKPTTPVEAIGSMVGLEPGMKAPPFEGMIHTGETLRSEQLSGHRFLLWFYPRASTGG